MWRRVVFLFWGRVWGVFGCGDAVDDLATRVCRGAHKRDDSDEDEAQVHQDRRAGAAADEGEAGGEPEAAAHLLRLLKKACPPPHPPDVGLTSGPSATSLPTHHALEPSSATSESLHCATAAATSIPLPHAPARARPHSPHHHPFPLGACARPTCCDPHGVTRGHTGSHGSHGVTWGHMGSHALSAATRVAWRANEPWRADHPYIASTAP